MQLDKGVPLVGCCATAVRQTLTLEGRVLVHLVNCHRNSNRLQIHLRKAGQFFLLMLDLQT